MPEDPLKKSPFFCLDMDRIFGLDNSERVGIAKQYTNIQHHTEQTEIRMYVRDINVHSKTNFNGGFEGFPGVKKQF